MSDEELIAWLRKADEYEPLGHDGWEAAARIAALTAQLAEAQAETLAAQEAHVFADAAREAAEAEAAALRERVAELVAEVQPLRTKTLQDAVAMERAARIIANGQPDKISDAAAILRAAISEGGKDG